VLAQPTIKAEQGRAFIPFSLELGQDWNGIQAELARLVSDAKDVLDATKFTVGSGTNEPTGVVTGLAVGQRIQTLTVGVYALGDPWLLKAAIPARLAASSTFVATRRSGTRRIGSWDGWQRVWSICKRRPASADDPHVPLALNSPRGTTF
jgi:HK97 family phage major capsid protein